MTKIRHQQEGKCPKCGSENIDYQDDESVDNCIVYTAICGDCQTEFKE